MNCFDEGIAELRSRGLTGAGVRIGLLDTGVNPDGLEQAIAFRKVSTDGFELIECMACDSGQHGTAMATKILDLASEATLLVAEVIEAGDIAARVLTGLDWLAQAGAQVICMPLGLPPPAPALAQFVRKLARDHILVVAAAGNGGAGTMLAPAICTSAISVGALDASGCVAAYSGSELVDRQILPRFAIPSSGKEGTSSSAARMAGLIAMLLGAHGADPAQVIAALDVTARPVPHQAHRVGAGTVDPVAAFDALMTVEINPDNRVSTLPPTAGVTPRLADRLRYADKHAQIRAIICFETRSQLANALAGIERLRVRRYELAPAVLVVGTVADISSLIAAEGFHSAESADVDRSAYAFGRISRFRPPKS